MAATPVISLVIATYNRGPSIARTLDSVLAQTHRPDEILVVDDCSTDGTGSWVQEHYPTVRVARTPSNLRTSGARNYGASHATGDVLAFLDHDDELLPHALETLLANLKRFPKARASFADHTYVNHASGVRYSNHHFAQSAFARLHRVAARERDGEVRLYGKEMYYALLRGNLLQQPWAIYRETFQTLGGFAAEVRYCEDWDLYLRVAHAVPLVLTDRVISNHVIEGENLHLAAGQAEMHMKVIRRQLAAQRWRDPRAATVLRRRLAQYYKSAGDQLRQSSLRQAWKHYAASFFTWPFDHVVAARTLLWLGPLCLGKP
ncbi:MAG: glycosyltransferase family 2 protein [Gemmataceae bacterium]